MVPEIIRRVGWTAAPVGILTTMEPDELGLNGFPRQRVACRILAMNSAVSRTEVTVSRFLVQIGYGDHVMQITQGALVDLAMTMKPLIAKLPPRFGWPSGRVRRGC